MLIALPRRARILGRILLGVVLFALVAAGAGVAGVTASMRAAYPSAAGADLTRHWPPPAPPPVTWPAAEPGGRIVVAVVVGATGSVATDVLAPYEVFASSPRFAVYTVAERREPVVLSGGLHFVPDHTLSEVDTGAVPAPDLVVVPAVVDPTGPREAPLRRFLARQAERGTRLLGVCAGSQLLAAAGVLDGRQATSFWAIIDGLRSSYPDVDWLAGRRYVEDGPVTTTAGVTSGIVGALRLVELLAGTEEAARIGREVAYPGWSPGASPAIEAHRLALPDLPYALSTAFPWLRPTVGVGLVDGLGEIDVAAAFEVYGGTSFAARTVPVAVHHTVTTRHGVLLLANPVGADPTGGGTTGGGTAGAGTAGAGTTGLDRLVVPGLRSVDQVDPELVRWATGQRLSVDLPHATRAPGESSFDPLLRDLARYTDRATAVATAKFTEYPASRADLAGGVWPWRPTVLLVLVLLAAAAVAVLPTAVRHAVVSRSGRRTASR